LKINSNINAYVAANALSKNQRVMDTAMERLSTGVRINSAADDAAGLAITSKMTSQINGLKQAVRNANDAVALVQVADGATAGISDMLQRMRELAVQAANGSYTANDRQALDNEFQQLSGEIDRIATDTQWNGKKLLDGTGFSGGVATFQIGANASHTLTTDLGSVTTDLLGAEYPDLFHNSRGSIWVHKNDGDGNFNPLVDADNDYYIDTDDSNIVSSVPSGSGTFGLAMGDGDGDGDTDLYSMSGGIIREHINDGNGNYSDGAYISDIPNEPFVAISGRTSGLAMGDGDGDGDADLYSMSSGIVYKHENDGNGNFGDGVDIGLDGPFMSGRTGNPSGLTMGDGDKDGDVDLYKLAGALILMFENDGNGNFSKGVVVGYSDGVQGASGLAMGDPDLDGNVSLYSMTGGEIYLHENDGNGNFGVGSFVNRAYYAYSYIGLAIGPRGNGISIASANLRSEADIYKAIESVDRSIQKVNDFRASYGATLNRLEYVVNNLTNTAQNNESSRSRILDTNYAIETTELARSQIIQQAAMAMLVQANQQPNQVLELLKSI
jgi:flagellin